jgi:hypothetical protein
MVGKTAPMTRHDELRFHVIRNYCGCLCCLLQTHNSGWDEFYHTTIEHVTDAGRRLENEHQATIGLCPWHHQGVPWSALQARDMVPVLGPSLAHGRKPFEDHFGDEVEVLLPLQDELIVLFAREFWQEYTVPQAARHAVWQSWKQRLKRR